MAMFYSAGITTPAAAAGAAYATIAAPAGTRMLIREIGVFCNAATATSVDLRRATNTYVATTTVSTVSHDPGDEAGEALIGTAWSTAPTTGTVPLRRAVLPAAIGAGIVWQFDDLIAGPVGTTALVLWNFGGAAGSACSVYVVCDD